MKPRLRLLALLTTLLLPALAVAQVTPDKAIATMKVADDLQIELFAAEPMLINPTSIDVDHKGRVWVCEAVNYRRINFGRPILRPEGDRIVVLEDTTGSGKADKSHVFYQGKEIIAPLGVAVLPYPDGKGQRVFVCQSPDILVFEDKEGRLKADGPPKKFLTGFGGFDHDHGVHGIHVGPDGKLWFTVGDTGVHGLQSSDGKGRKWESNDTDCRAGTVWRCDIDGRNLELIAHNFRNNYMVCEDSFGNVFLSDNDDDGQQQTRICFVMPGGDYGYHPRAGATPETHWHEQQPGVVPKILRTGFGSPTGIRVYEGDLLPKRFKGQLLHTDAGPREFRAFHLKPNGAGYDCEKEILVTSSDAWFRLSDVCVGPDGSVFLADWYDPGVGGHGMGDWTRGRIYRVTPKGHKGYKVPDIDTGSVKGLQEALTSPNRAVLAMAIAKLRSMPSDEFFRTWLPIVKDANDPILATRILWTMTARSQLDGALHAINTIAEKNTDERMRQFAVRLLRDRYYDFPTEEIWGRDSGDKMANDISPAVRREWLLFLRVLPAESVKSAFYALAKKYDGKDRFYLEALGIAAGKEPKRRAALLADFSKHFPTLDDKTLDLIWELRPPDTAAIIEKNLADEKLPAARRDRLIDILVGSDDKESGRTLIKLLQMRLPPEVRFKMVQSLRVNLSGKWQYLRQSPELTKLIANRLEANGDHETAMILIAAAGRVDMLAVVEKHANAADEAIPTRWAAIDALGRLPGKEAVVALEKMVTMDPPSMRIAVIRAMALHLPADKIDQPEAIEVIAAFKKLLLDKEIAANLRQASLQAIAGTRPGASWLLEANAKGELPAELKGEAGRLLRNSPYQDLRNKAMIAFPTSPRLDLKKLPPIPVLAARKGDAAKGRIVLANSVSANTQCLKCHTVQGAGGQIGPDLSLIGKKASRENLLESMLFPSKAIADQYIQWQIETKKGVVVTGLIVEDTADAVLLRDANGKDTRIAKKDIETKTRSPLSIMPEDIASNLSEEELIDLVEYMLTLKTAVLGMDYWHIVGPFDNVAEDQGIDKVFPPEKSVDLKATYDGKAGKVSWRIVKPDAKGYVDLRAFFAPHSEEIVSYLYREFESPVDQDATILLGNDDACKVWINDKLVYTNRDHNAAMPEQARVSVKLTKGVNRVLFKINNGAGEHGLYFSLQSEQELKRLTSK